MCVHMEVCVCVCVCVFVCVCLRERERVGDGEGKRDTECVFYVRVLCECFVCDMRSTPYL